MLARLSTAKRRTGAASGSGQLSMSAYIQGSLEAYAIRRRPPPKKNEKHARTSSEIRGRVVKSTHRLMSGRTGVHPRSLRCVLFFATQEIPVERRAGARPALQYCISGSSAGAFSQTPFSVHEISWWAVAVSAFS